MVGSLASWWFWSQDSFCTHPLGAAPVEARECGGLIGSDVPFWSALHLALGPMIGTVLATPPALVKTASSSVRARLNAMLDNILPVSARAAGLRSDTDASKTVASFVVLAFGIS